MNVLTILAQAFTIAADLSALETGGTTAPIRLGNSYYTITETDANGNPLALSKVLADSPVVAGIVGEVEVVYNHAGSPILTIDEKGNIGVAGNGYYAGGK
jgi:hypothetical protein